MVIRGRRRRRAGEMGRSRSHVCKRVRTGLDRGRNVTHQQPAGRPPRALWVGGRRRLLHGVLPLRCAAGAVAGRRAGVDVARAPTACDPSFREGGQR